MASGPPEDQRPEETLHLTDTPTPEAGVLSDPNRGKDPLKTSAESAERDEDGVGVCRFFLKGRCHFGHRCRFSHSDPSIDDDRDDKQDGEKMEKHKKKVNTMKPRSETIEVNKKPRMRTADDVISRILWDQSVDGSEFVVGYVDRFLGVLERPFNDFNWDTDPCDCDYSCELALPRHRIQYFTHRGHRVWDRHSRTDRVFGSTGQSLAPPFGGEEEVKEMNAEEQQGDELKATEEQQGDELKATEEQQPADSLHLQGEGGAEECPVVKHLEEETQSEMNTHTADSPKERKGSGGARVPGEAAVRPKTSSEEENLSEQKESWEEDDGDASSCIAALKMSENPSAPQEQREKRGGRPARKQPTHFITFRANTPAILSSFQQLREEVTSLLPSCAPHWQTAARLHVTMCLLNLSGPAQVAAAGEVLRRFARLDRNPPVSLTFPVKLKHFGGRVLYLSPQPQLHLQQLNGGLQEAFREEGWLHKNSYNPRYHLTLAKVEDKTDRVFDGVGDLRVGKGVNFGRLPVNTLHLCAMGGHTVDGFYETLCTVTLR